MKNLLIFLFLSILFAISCQTNAENVETKLTENETLKAQTENSPTPTPKLEEQDINSKIGIVDGSIENVCFRTKNGDLAKDTAVSIVTSLYESPQKVLNAKIEKKLEKSCARYASESTDKNPGENFYYKLSLLEEVDEYQEVFGIGVIEPKTPFQIQNNLVSIDLNGDGKAEFFRRCAGFEGTLFAIWTGKPLKGKQVWYSFYYVDYDTEPNCKKEDR